MLISNVRNSLLAQISASDLAALSGHLEPIELPKNFELASFNEKISHYYFIEIGVGSMVAVSPSGKKAEVGLVGKDGVTPDCRHPRLRDYAV
jgi:CRP-like cAMP-binding protein